MRRNRSSMEDVGSLGVEAPATAGPSLGGMSGTVLGTIWINLPGDRPADGTTVAPKRTPQVFDPNQTQPTTTIGQLRRVAVDHLMYAMAAPLEAAVADFYTRTGVQPLISGSHQGLGTRSALVALGGAHLGAYLELITIDTSQPAPARAWLDIDATGCGGAPRLVAWASARQDLSGAVAAARAHGFDPGEPAVISRLKADGSVVTWCMSLTQPVSGSGAVPALVSWEGPSPAIGAPTGCVLEVP